MIKEIMSLLVLLSVATSLTNPFNYEGYYMISAENYVLELPTVLTDSANINQKYWVSLLPDVYVNDKKINLLGYLISPSNEGNKFNPADSYLTRITNIFDDIEVTSEMRVLEEYIETKIIIVNKRKESVSISLGYNVSSGDNFTLFDPSQYSGQINSYLIAMPTEEIGPSLGIIFPGINLKTERVNFQEISLHRINIVTEDVSPENSITVVSIFYPMNIQMEEELYYPIEFSDYTKQKTVRTRGLISELETIERLDLFMEEKIPGMKAFSHMHLVDLHSSIDNYLTAAIYYDKMCEMGGYICKVYMTEDDGDYYAWVEHYERDGWVKSPLYSNVPEYSKLIYQEPTSRLVTVKTGLDDKNKAYYDATSFLLDINKSEALLYFGLIILLAIVMLAIIQVKAKSIIKRDKRVALTIKVDPNGDYTFLKEKSFGDPFLDELIKIIKQRNGNVDVKEIEELTKYSVELISFGVEYLSDEGIIRKKGKPMGYKQITETKGLNIYNAEEKNIGIKEKKHLIKIPKIKLPKVKGPKIKLPKLKRREKKEKSKEEKTKDLEILKAQLKGLKGNR